MANLTIILTILSLVLVSVIFLHYYKKRKEINEEVKDFLDVLLSNYLFKEVTLFNIKSKNKNLVFLTKMDTKFTSKAHYDLLFEATINNFLCRQKINESRIEKVVSKFQPDEGFCSQINTSKLTNIEKLVIWYKIAIIAKEKNLVEKSKGSKAVVNEVYLFSIVERKIIINILKSWGPLQY